MPATEEIVEAFEAATGAGGPRGGALHTVVVTGARVVQVLAPLPLADDSSGVLYLRLVRARATLASVLREVETATRGRTRRPAGRAPGGVAAMPSAGRAAAPSGIPGTPSGPPAATPRNRPSRSNGRSAAASPGVRPSAGARTPLAGTLAARRSGARSTAARPGVPSSPPATPAALPSAAVVPAPRASTASPAEGPTAASGRSDGPGPTSVTDPTETSAQVGAVPAPLGPGESLEARVDALAPSRAPFPAAEFFAAAHRARPPLPPGPVRGPARGAEGPENPDAGTARAGSRRGVREGPPPERLSGAPGSTRPRRPLSSPGPASIPGDEGASAGGDESAGTPEGAAARSDPGATGPVLPGRGHPGRAVAGDGDPVPVARELPRRRGDTVIPPPREPDDTAQGRRWTTDVPTLRRLADGLRRRLR